MYATGILLLAASLISHIGVMAYWTARQNERASQQKKFMIKDIYDCLRAESYAMAVSPRDTIVKTFRNCITAKISYCVHSSQTRHDIKQPMIIQTYCGMISGTSVYPQPSMVEAYFTAWKNYVMHFNVYVFEFEWSTVRCEKQGLLIFNSATSKTMCFTGRRKPWIMIFNGGYTAIKLQAVEPYKILIFYSIHSPNWLYDFAEGKYINLKADKYLPIRSIPKVSYSVTERYHIHVKVDIMRRVVFIIQKGRTDDVLFYDGPGILSNRLWEVKKNIFFTSGFHGFFVLRRKRSQTFSISLQYRYRTTPIPTCLAQHNSLPLRIFGAVSMNEGGICFRQFRLRYDYLSLYVETFVFDGPTSLDGSEHCYYGGLYVELVNHTTSLCENSRDYKIYGEAVNLTMLLVWYSGYSHGRITGYILREDCYTRYVHLSSSPVYHQIVLEDEVFCHYMICLYIKTGQGQHCKFHVRDITEVIGPVSIDLSRFHSMYRCSGDTGLYNTPHNTSFRYFRGDWLLSSAELLSEPTTVRRFKFTCLQDFNTSLPFTCDPAMPFIQIGILLKRSMYSVNNKKSHFIMGSLVIRPTLLHRAHRIDVLKDKATSYLFMVDKKETVHKGGPTTFELFFDNCPVECRNYTYIWTVQYRNTVTRYTSQQKDITIFIGYFHQNFNVTVIPRTNKCKRLKNCVVAIAFGIHKYPVGVYNEPIVYHRTQKWSIHSRRYMVYIKSKSRDLYMF